MKNLSLRQLHEIVKEGNLKYSSDAVLAAKKELSLRDEIKSTVEIPEELSEETRSTSTHNKRIKPRQPFRFIRSLFKLVFRPDTHRIKTSEKNRILLTVRFYFLTLLLLFLSLTPLIFIASFIDTEIPKQTIYQLDKMHNAQDRLYLAFLIPVVAALVEETSFRLVLSKFNQRYFNISVAFLVSYIIADLFGAQFLTYSTFQSYYIVQGLLVQLTFGIPVYLSLTKTRVHSSWFEENWEKAYRWIFYGSALIFATAHLPNFGFSKDDIILWPFYLLPFLVYAFVFSFLRIRIGFIYAVLLHFIVNGVIVVVKLLRT